MTYVHPVIGAAVLVLLVYTASLGLRLRGTRRQYGGLASRHARFGATLYGLVLVTWIAGVLSTLWLRPDMKVSESLHFRIGSAIAVLLTGSAATAWLMRRGRPQLRDVHPWLGAAAVLAAAAQFASGLRIMP